MRHMRHPEPFLKSWQVGRAMELKKVIDYAAVTVDGPQVLVESILDQACRNPESCFTKINRPEGQITEIAVAETAFLSP